MRDRHGGKLDSDLGYRPDLDGLRALAVLPVLAFHLWPAALRGGFVGVDVFFVLSGFLITRQIAAELANGTFTLANFYDRRIRRIAPALLLMLAVTTVAALALMFPNDLEDYGVTLATAAASVSNVRFAMESGYFEPTGELSPLLHTWSLAVEDQFYLLFPILLLSLWRSRRDAMLPIVGVIFLLSLAASVAGTTAYPEASFFLLPTRAWELLLGALLALGAVRLPTKPWQRELSAVAGVSAIVGAVLTFSPEIAFPGIAALLPCAGAALVIWSGIPGKHGEMGRADATGASRPAFATALLGLRIPVLIGLMSYSLYLWHWPAIVFASYAHGGPLPPAPMAALIAGIFAVSYASWRWVEVPMRRGRWPWAKPHDRFAFAAAAVVLIAGAGLAINRADGFPGRLTPAVAELATKVHAYSPERERCHFDGFANKKLSDTCVLGAAVAPKIIVFADSHGVELSYALGEEARRRGASIRQITASGCPPVIGFTTEKRPECAAYVQAMLTEIAAEPPSTVVVMAHYFGWSKGATARHFWPNLQQAIAALRNAGHSVIVVGGVPPHPGKYPVPYAVARSVQMGGNAADYQFPLDQDFAAMVDGNLARIAAASHAVYAPLVPYLCPKRATCDAYRDGEMLYFDDNHMSLAAARSFTRDRLAPLLWPPADPAG